MQIACLPEERKMPKISFDPESGEHKVIGVITTVNVKHGGSLFITETENGGVTTTTVEFNNGGTFLLRQKPRDYVSPAKMY
jgi:hypothetical protein